MKTKITFLLLLGLNVNIFACSCMSGNIPFLKTSQHTSLSVHIKVLSQIIENMPRKDSFVTGIEAEIIEVLKSQTTKKIIKIYGDTGNLCRPYAQWFTVNSEYLMNLYPGDKSYKTSEFDKPIRVNMDYEFDLKKICKKANQPNKL